MAVQATLAWEEKGRRPRAQRGPVAGAATKFSHAPSTGVFGFVPLWTRSIFSSSCVVVRAWCLVPGVRRRCFRRRWCYASARGARGVQGGVLARGRVVLPCGCGCRCGGVCAATLAASGVRAVESARAVVAWCARWVLGRGEVGVLVRLWAGRGIISQAVCMRPPLSLCSRCRRCCRRSSAPWPRPCPPGARCVLMASPAAHAARRRAGRRRCWRGVGGRCRSWP